MTRRIVPTEPLSGQRKPRSRNSPSHDGQGRAPQIHTQSAFWHIGIAADDKNGHAKGHPREKADLNDSLPLTPLRSTTRL